ncbi:MAG: YggT family protein [Maritimibacter harenae]|jgi:YggT family protein|uniref:YggT family protein n=1 Tax=Maritimibacter harenae TaxID=2606218 RepID=A0A845M7C5_9RHOB|nr:YggT family protein [Maritimibacter harenae]MZR13637.1 YggT family protein [Maritimibacter harenae]
MLSLMQIILAILNVIWFIVIVHIIMSWLINFQVLNLHQRFVAQLWYGLNRLVDPVYSRIRRILPDMGGIDLSPVIVLLALFAVRTVIQNNMYQFY